jgi:hypothetical protein
MEAIALLRIARVVKTKCGSCSHFDESSKGVGGKGCRKSSYCICAYFCTAKVALMMHLSRVSIATHGRTRRNGIPVCRYSWFRGVGACRLWHVGCAASISTRLLVWRVILSASVVPSAKRVAELRTLASFPYCECVSVVCCVVGDSRELAQLCALFTQTLAHEEE